jgi:hypothetical protein
MRPQRANGGAPTIGEGTKGNREIPIRQFCPGGVKAERKDTPAC